MTGTFYVITCTCSAFACIVLVYISIILDEIIDILKEKRSRQNNERFEPNHPMNTDNKDCISKHP